MDFDSYYEISRTANFICERNFTRVALQFPDEQLKDATKVVSAVRDKVHSLRECSSEGCENARDVRLFVMADTTYGSCCVDEVGASHIGADFVVHYGHTCLSPTSTLPALFIFGKASINIAKCAESLSDFALAKCKPIVVLYGLEYAHAIHHIKEFTFFESRSTSTTKLQYANVMTLVMDPPNGNFSSIGNPELDDSSTTNANLAVGRRYNIGGLTWNIPEGHKMDDYMLIWIGSENSAFANVVLTFNGCDIVRYNAKENCFVADASLQRRTLKRRYYLVEKAKDANIIGILVGTLGVAGYLHMIRQMKELITGAGKKAYTFVMGKPNPAKLANFPECDVFIYVSCAQTALLDSKEYLAPVITPFEALLAFSRGSQWTGEYVMEFRDLITSPMVGVGYPSEEARFSFLQGGYVEDFQENGQEDEEVGLALAHATERALQVRDDCSKSMIERSAKSGAEFLAARSYRGLNIHNQDSLPKPFFIGRTGRASGYDDEKGMLED